MALRLRSLSVSIGLAVSLVAGAARAKPVDLRSARVTERGVVAKIDGAEVKLTLDPHLQKAAERLLANAHAHEGAIVASDVKTGRILAWASTGDRDFVALPFAPSASVFKIVTSAALVESGVSPSTRVCYDGGGEHAITLADLDARGSVCTTMDEALGHSVNLVFAKLATEKLHPSDLTGWATKLGFLGKVPIDVEVVASDLSIPTDRLGFAKASAGFWNGHLSPLGALYAMQAIADDGVPLDFDVVDRGAVTARPRPRVMSSKTASALTKMLEITTRRGTAAKAFKHADGTPYFRFPVAAKTGTLVGGKPSRMYSWLAAFAPSTKPEIAITVMLGNDVTWTTKANIVGRELLEAYFEPNAPIASAAASKHKKHARADRRSSGATRRD